MAMAAALNWGQRRPRERTSSTRTGLPCAYASMAGPSPRVNSRSWTARALPSNALATLGEWAGAISERAAPLTGRSATHPRHNVLSDGDS